MSCNAVPLVWGEPDSLRLAPISNMLHILDQKSQRPLITQKSYFLFKPVSEHQLRPTLAVLIPILHKL